MKFYVPPQIFLSEVLCRAAAISGPEPFPTANSHGVKKALVREACLVNHTHAHSIMAAHKPGPASSQSINHKECAEN